MKNYVDKDKLQEYTTKLTNKYKTMFSSPLVASTVAEMTDTNKIYVYIGSESGYTSGNWYYYNGSAWTSGGVYNAVAVETDTTLSVSGKAADAKAVGDALEEVQVGTDTTLTESGVPADAKATGDKVTELKSAFEVTLGTDLYTHYGNYYINKSSGAFTADSRYDAVNYLPVKEGEQYLITGQTDSSSVSVVSFYNRGKAFQSSLLDISANKTNIVTIPGNGFIRVCTKIELSPIAIYKYLSTDTLKSDIDNTLESNTFVYNDFIDLTPDKNGYWGTNGAFTPDTGNIYHTYNVEINKGEKVIIFWRASQTVAAVAEFDSTYSTFVKTIQAGFTSTTRMADNVFEATKDTYLVISSGDGGASIMYLSDTDNGRKEITHWHDAMYINGSGAIITSGATGYMTSALFPLRQGDTLRISNLFINVNTTTVGRWDVDNRVADLTADLKQSTAYLADFEYTASDPIEYLRISTRTTDGCKAYIYPNGALAKGALNFDRLNLKRFLVIGDSYAAGKEIDQKLVWCGIIAREHCMDIVNYAEGGQNSAWVLSHISEMDDTADYVGVVCGRNDYNFQVPIATFKTQIAQICDALIAKYPGAKLFFLTPWHVEEQTEIDIGLTAQTIPLQDYVDAIVEVCGKKSFPCWDASRNSAVFVDNAAFRAKYFYSQNDVSHLNAAGFRYVTPKIEAFMEQL